MQGGTDEKLLAAKLLGLLVRRYRTAMLDHELKQVQVY
jgi:hypothetical protein